MQDADAEAQHDAGSVLARGSQVKESIRALLDSIPEEKRRLKGRKALAYLATLMRRIPREDYDHRSYFGASGAIVRTRDDFLHCGTAACAAGWGSVVFDGSPDPCSSIKSIAMFYSITLLEARSIFLWRGYLYSPSPRTVAKRIRAVLKEYK